MERGLHTHSYAYGVPTRQAALPWRWAECTERRRRRRGIPRGLAVCVGLLLALAHPVTEAAKGGTNHAPTENGHHGANYATGVPHNAHGRIVRDPRARNAFKRANPCPATGKASGPCPGYVIDHVTPLKRGGADAPSNMQWQTEAAAKAKDRTE